MPAEVIKIDPLNPAIEVIQKAARYIREGKLVAIPTETVYGLAANSANTHAVKKLYEVKVTRSEDKPFSICIARKDEADNLAQNILPFAYRLMDSFWPGPVTLVLKSKNAHTIGLRMPSNKVAQDIIFASGVNVFLPSANVSGHPSPNSAEEVLADIGGMIDLIVDGGRVEIGIESTVVDAVNFPPKILRVGAVKEEEIMHAAKRKRVLFVCTGNSCRSVMAQGLLEKALKVRNISDIEVLSCGVSALPGIGPTRETILQLAADNIDMSAYRALHLTTGLLKSSDLILAMEDIHERRILEIVPAVKNRLYLLKEFAKIDDNSLNIADPIGASESFYHKTFYEIKECIEKIVDLL